VAGRLSALKSDGYIDRASSDLKSFFYKERNLCGKTTLIKALAFGGTENLSVLEWFRRFGFAKTTGLSILLECIQMSLENSFL
jgi:hypothetical protein